MRTAAGYFAGHTEILHIFTYIAESALFLFNHFNFCLPYVTSKCCQLEICILEKEKGVRLRLSDYKPHVTAAVPDLSREGREFL